MTEDKVIASRDPGTSMNFALELTGLLAGKAKCDQVEMGLQRDK
jgi:4-methyl-5(b-hydroxyethyl)-thiazole monophosphate biosynthesis